MNGIVAIAVSLVFFISPTKNVPMIVDVVLVALLVRLQETIFLLF